MPANKLEVRTQNEEEGRGEDDAEEWGRGNDRLSNTRQHIIATYSNIARTEFRVLVLETRGQRIQLVLRNHVHPIPRVHPQ